MTTALITGATGFVGSHLMRELSDNSYNLRVLRRQSSSTKLIDGFKYENVIGDITDKDSLLAAMQGVDYVFHLAALYREAKFPDQVYWQVNFEGTRNVLQVAKQTKVKRVLYCSTTGVHGNIDDPPANEQYRYNPCDVYQESKTEAEKFILEWFRSGQGQGSIIRPTMIWGPNDTRIFKLFKGIATRTLPIIGDGKTLNHWILVEDLVRAFRLAAESQNSNGEVYLIGGERVVTLEHTMRTIAKAYQVDLLPFRLPAWPIQFAGSVCEALCKPFGIEPPLHRRRCDFFVKSRAFDCSKAKADLGFEPRFNFEDEAAYVARWYLDNDWIKLDQMKRTNQKMAANG